LLMREGRGRGEYRSRHPMRSPEEKCQKDLGRGAKKFVWREDSDENDTTRLIRKGI